MTGRTGGGPATAGGWRECITEIIVAGIFLTTAIAAVYAFAGLGAALIAVSLGATALLLMLRGLVPPASKELPPPEQDRPGDRGQTSFFGFWRKRAVLTEASDSMTAYEAELRQTLQHLLAARLSERHGVSLHSDPQAARDIFLQGQPEELWYWLDPGRPAETDRKKRGIPLRTLTSIIDRLERL